MSPNCPVGPPFFFLSNVVVLALGLALPPLMPQNTVGCQQPQELHHVLLPPRAAARAFAISASVFKSKSVGQGSEWERQRRREEGKEEIRERERVLRFHFINCPYMVREGELRICWMAWSGRGGQTNYEPFVSREPGDLSLVFHRVTCSTLHSLCLIKFQVSYQNTHAHTQCTNDQMHEPHLTITQSWLFLWTALLREQGSQQQGISLTVSWECAPSRSANCTTFQGAEGARASS